MHQNRFWLAFLTVLTLIVLWYCGVAIYRTYEYIRLTAQTNAEVYEWAPKEISGDVFAAHAYYTFDVKGTQYKGEDVLPSPLYRNTWAIEQEIPKLSKEKRIVWFDPTNPLHSSLQKRFPLKECVSAIVLLGLLLYFVGLGFYVARRE